MMSPTVEAASGEKPTRERYRHSDLAALLVAAAIGLVIAYVDSRPNWDDTGITAFALFASAGLLGFIAPRRPWLTGIAVGIGTVGAAVVHDLHSGFATLAYLVILLIPLAGAYVGALARRLFATN
jgi:hypothetical protein